MSVTGVLQVYNNVQLTECCAIYELINEVNGHYVGGTISIYNNQTGCDNVAQINAECDNNYGGNGGAEEIGKLGNC